MDDLEMLSSVSGFQFSGKPVNDLESSEYTIANILVDESGSVNSFKNELERAIRAAVESCAKSPRAEAMLVRVAAFADTLREIHGFLPLSDIDLNRYDGSVHPHGSTALHDATLESIETVDAYANKLVANRYTVNGICFIITDGGENASRTANIAKIVARIDQIRQQEKLESLKIVLVGVGGYDFTTYAANAKFDQYVNIGDATPQKLARLADFVSKSISSSSQALGTGGASQNITF